MNDYITKLATVLKGRAVVCIDAANLEKSVQDMRVNPKDVPNDLKGYSIDKLCWRFDYYKFKKFFKRICNLKEISFYSAVFNSFSHDQFLVFLKRGLRFRLILKPLKEYNDHKPETPHRKANFDVEIAVDATALLSDYEVFILFSGDCDFAYLITFLRRQGKVVIVFSRSGHVAKELPPAANYYFDIVDFRQEILKVFPKKQKTPLI